MLAPVEEHRRGRLLLHPDADRARVVLEDVLDVGGLVAAARSHAIESLGVAARVVVDFEVLIAGDLQLVGDRADLDRVEGRLDGLQVLAGQLEAIIPEAILPGPEDLGLLPAVDAILGPRASLHRLVDQRGRTRDVGLALGRVGDHHLVSAIAVREEIKDPLFLHEPAGEGEIRLAVLNAVVAGEIGALKLIGYGQAGEDLFEDVGDGELLEDPALVIPREHPELGNHLRAIGGQRTAPLGRGDLLTLGKPAHDPVEVARGAVGHHQGDGDGLAENRVERDRGGGIGQQLKLEAEQLRVSLLAGELLEEQDIRPERRRHGQEPIRLTVLRHGFLTRVAAELLGTRRRSKLVRHRVAKSDI